MRFLDEYRDAETGRAVLAELARVAAPLPPVKIMEVCGGHTHALHRFGVLDLLPVAVMIARGDLALSVDVRSDSAPIVDEVAALLSAVPSVRVLRDPTRGGLATVVNELVIGLGGRRRLDVLVGDPLPRIC